MEGSNFEFLASDSIVQFSAIVESSTSSNELQALFTLGGASLIQPPFGAVFAAGTTETPHDLFHNLIRVGGSAGERLFLTLRNDASDAVVCRWALRIDPV